MLSGFQNASRVPELRRRVLFTLGMLAVYRLGVHVPTPGIDRHAMAAFFEQQKGTLFGFLNLFSGGALEQFSVFLSGHHALHQRFHHLATSYRSLSLPRTTFEGRRNRPA